MTKFGAEFLGQGDRQSASAIFARLLQAELLLGALVGALVLVYAWADPSTDAATLALVGFSVLLVTVEVFFQAAAKGSQDFRIFSQASLVGGLLYAAAAITAVSLGLGIYTLLLAYIARRILTIILIGWKLPTPLLSARRHPVQYPARAAPPHSPLLPGYRSHLRHQHHSLRKIRNILPEPLCYRCRYRLLQSVL